MPRIHSIVMMVLFLGVVPAWADSLPNNVRGQLRLYWQTKDPGDLADLAGTDLLSFYIHDRMVREQTPGRISLDAFRNDLQLGSFSPVAASTSIVARPGLTDVLSMAMESGAVGRKTDDKAITFSFNGLPLYQLMGGRLPAGCGSYDEICREGTGRWIRGLSGSVTINTSDATVAVPGDAVSTAATSSPSVFLLGGRKLSALSTRYEFFVRERKAKDEDALDAAAKELSTKAEAFLKSQEDFETRLAGILEKAGWPAETRRALQNATSLEGMEEILLNRYRIAWEIAMASPDLQRMAAAVFPEKLKYIEIQNKVLADKLYRKALTVDYMHQRPTDQPWLHQVRLIAYTPLGRKPSEERTKESRSAAIPAASITFNAGVTFYHNISAVPGLGRVRDAQASVAFDWSPAGWGAMRPTYTAAYYFQYMIENGVLQFTREAVTPDGGVIALPKPAIEILNTRGSIHIAQIRISIPLGSTGVSFPAAVSYSNRTELIAGKSFWQGHFGITYDLSRLKSLLKPGGGNSP